MKNINKIKEKIDWDKYYSLNNEFEWYRISYNETLSEDFMREFKDKVNWVIITKYQKLSEEFIEEMSVYLDWNYVFKYQKLSKEFKRKYRSEYETYLGLNYAKYK